MLLASLVLLVSVLLVAVMNWPEMREAWRKTSAENIDRVLDGAGGEPGPDGPAPAPSSAPLTRPGASITGVEPRALPPEVPGSVSRVFDQEAELRSELWPLLHRELW